MISAVRMTIIDDSTLRPCINIVKTNYMNYLGKSNLWHYSRIEKTTRYKPSVVRISFLISFLFRPFQYYFNELFGKQILLDWILKFPTNSDPESQELSNDIKYDCVGTKDPSLKLEKRSFPNEVYGKKLT